MMDKMTQLYVHTYKDVSFIDWLKRKFVVFYAFMSMPELKVTKRTPHTKVFGINGIKPFFGFRYKQSARCNVSNRCWAC